MFPALCTTLMYENALISPNILKDTFIWVEAFPYIGAPVLQTALKM